MQLNPKFLLLVGSVTVGFILLLDTEPKVKPQQVEEIVFDTQIPQETVYEFHEILKHPEPVDPTSTAEETPKSVSKDEINNQFEYQYELPKGLLDAIHMKETSGRCNVESRVGAKGCFQFMPITIRHIEQKFNTLVNPYDYESSALGASIYLSYLKKKINKHYPNLREEIQWGLVLASYNGGPSNGLLWASKAHKRKLKTHSELSNVITFKETRNYVNTITSQVFGVEHVVESGDTVWKIARMYNIDTKVLLSQVGEKIYVGQVIKLNLES
jgi:hypothetical protein